MNDKEYYFIDIDLYSRQIVNWSTETREHLIMKPKNGLYRAFLSRGQYNKLTKELEDARN